ncbi:glycosyltransferase family 39 protein [Streptomyces sp. NPDC046860]|uniref:glycosyltransferase family 39 protein n=1 Tax=Streptomyces sp. NPDC046860 TaxID=3154495 RepID=UPI0033F48F40
MPGGSGGRRTGRVPWRVRWGAPVCLPALVMLGLGLWGVDRGGIWRDEAVTLQVARRSVPQIWQLLHGVDAVHGLYYLLMHAVLALPGVPSGEVVLRLPSVCAAAVTAALVGELGVRLAGPRVGLWAGLLYAVSPMAGHYAQEGRSYALVAAGATGATLLFVRAVRTGAWRAYGAVLAAACWLHEFAVLLLLAHAATLALARPGARVWRGWGSAAGVVGLALLPMVAVSHAQSAQLAWLRPPTWATAQGLLRWFLGPGDGVYWTCLVLAVLGLTQLAAPPGRLTCARVGLPLAVVPPAALMLASQVSPLYVDRYVLYALSGAPLLVAAGADTVARAGARLRLRVPRPPVLALTGAALAVLALCLQLPLMSGDRDPARRPDDLAATARVAARAVRAGEPVLFLPVQARNAALAYPRAFAGVRDVALDEPGPGSGTLYGREADAAEMKRRLAGLDRVWVVADRALLAGRWSPAGAAERAKLAVLTEEFMPAEEASEGDAGVRLYVRRVAVSAEPGPVPVPVPPRPGPR